MFDEIPKMNGVVGMGDSNPGTILMEFPIDTNRGCFSSIHGQLVDIDCKGEVPASDPFFATP